MLLSCTNAAKANVSVKWLCAVLICQILSAHYKVSYWKMINSSERMFFALTMHALWCRRPVIENPALLLLLSRKPVKTLLYLGSPVPLAISWLQLQCCIKWMRDGKLTLTADLSPEFLTFHLKWIFQQDINVRSLTFFWPSWIGFLVN